MEVLISLGGICWNFYCTSMLLPLLLFITIISFFLVWKIFFSKRGKEHIRAKKELKLVRRNFYHYFSFKIPWSQILPLWAIEYVDGIVPEVREVLQDRVSEILGDMNTALFLLNGKEKELSILYSSIRLREGMTFRQKIAKLQQLKKELNEVRGKIDRKTAKLIEAQTSAQKLNFRTVKDPSLSGVVAAATAFEADSTKD